MVSSCLNYSSVMLRKKLPSLSFHGTKDKNSEICTFSVPLLKKKGKKSTRLQQNGCFNAATETSQNVLHTRVMSSDASICEHLETDNEGLGIVNFFTGKNVLITGATGFLGKVFLEKILRANPDVGKIYVIIKAKDDEAAKHRLIKEILNLELFGSLRAIHEGRYQDFMLEKIVPILGDLRKTNIGIKPEISEEIAKEVDVIVNSAANTNFHERYDVAMDMNTLGPLRVMDLAKKMKRLKLFVHISTTYVNGQRKGAILETPFCLGDAISSEMDSSMKSQTLNIEEEIKLAFSSATKKSISNAEKMKDLGLRRASMHGWQDTYVFTKAMGEMLINSMHEEIPVVIIRPSVIESTIKEPFPGWIEGTRMLDPLVLRYGKGQLTGFPVDSDEVLDIVPADMVVNATLAAIAKHGSCTNPELKIYQVASSKVNPLVFNQLFGMMSEHFSMYPVMDFAGQPIQVHPFKLFPKMSEFVENNFTDIMQRNANLAGLISNGKCSTGLKALCMNWDKQAKYLATIYVPYTFYSGRFDNTNTEELVKKMSEEERQKFFCNVESINWEEYIINVHIPGYRRHVMKK